jgi:hypothetical protein
VADVTAPLQHVGLLLLGQHAAAVGADERQRLLLARRLHLGHGGADGLRQRAADHHGGDRLREQVGRRHDVCGDVRERAGRHAGVQGVLRILHDGTAAERLDHGQAGRAVVARAGEEDTHHAAATLARR